MSQRLAALAALAAVALAIVMLCTAPALPHEVWINKQKRTNAAGEWCCNTYDCKVVQARETPKGYILENGEEVPRDETALSGDGDFWVCRRPDGSRRCFFAPLGS